MLIVMKGVISRMIQFIKRNKEVIIITIIIGILLFFIQPLLTFIGTQIVNLLVAMSTKFANYFFRLTAENDSNGINYNIATMVIALFSGVLISMIIINQHMVKASESKLKIFEQKKIGGEGDLKKEKEEANIESEIENLKKQVKKDKVLHKSLIAMVALALVYFWGGQVISSLVNSMNVSFQNSLTVLSVHLSDNEIKQLRAKWVQMQSADDFKQIKNAIADYSKKYNIK